MTCPQQTQTQGRGVPRHSIQKSPTGVSRVVVATNTHSLLTADNERRIPHSDLRESDKPASCTRQLELPKPLIGCPLARESLRMLRSSMQCLGCCTAVTILHAAWPVAKSRVWGLAHQQHYQERAEEVYAETDPDRNGAGLIGWCRRNRIGGSIAPLPRR